MRGNLGQNQITLVTEEENKKLCNINYKRSVDKIKAATQGY